jgi:hypothetical protein
MNTNNKSKSQSQRKYEQIKFGEFFCMDLNLVS